MNKFEKIVISFCTLLQTSAVIYLSITNSSYPLIGSTALIWILLNLFILRNLHPNE